MISLRIPSPQFDGCTREVLGSREVLGIVQRVVGRAVRAWARAQPDEGRRALGRARGKPKERPRC